MDDQEAVQHEWDVDVLERTLRTASTRYTVAVVLAVPATVLGVVGLVMGGTGPIWGLASLTFAAVALSFALRQKTKRDYCRGQLEQIGQRDANASPRTPGGSA